MSETLNGITNAVYAGAAKECEHREVTGHKLAIGNGHHMAQAIVKRFETKLTAGPDADVLALVHEATLAECESRAIPIALATAMAKQVMDNVQAQLESTHDL